MYTKTVQIIKGNGLPAYRLMIGFTEFLLYGSWVTQITEVKEIDTLALFVQNSIFYVKYAIH
jgi:uncharacterized protein (DUF486 family)